MFVRTHGQWRGLNGRSPSQAGSEGWLEVVMRRWWLLGTLLAPLCSLVLAMQPVEQRQGSADELEHYSKCRTVSMIGPRIVMAGWKMYHEKRFHSLLVQRLFDKLILNTCERIWIFLLNSHSSLWRWWFSFGEVNKTSFTTLSVNIWSDYTRN